MKIEWRKVTWYSKLLALGLFIALPFIGFCLGMRYEQLKRGASATSFAGMHE